MITSGLARYSERGKKTRRTKEEVGRQHQGMDRPGVWQVPEGSGEQGKWRKLVAKSSVVPQRPSRLRDRWWWWWFSSQQLLSIIMKIQQCTRPWNSWLGDHRSLLWSPPVLCVAGVPAWPTSLSSTRRTCCRRGLASTASFPGAQRWEGLNHNPEHLSTVHVLSW